MDKNNQFIRLMNWFEFTGLFPLRGDLDDLLKISGRPALQEHRKLLHGSFDLQIGEQGSPPPPIFFPLINLTAMQASVEQISCSGITSIMILIFYLLLQITCPLFKLHSTEKVKIRNNV